MENDYYDWLNDRQVSSKTSADYFRGELAKYPNTKKINIFINSYGGDVFEGAAIYSQLKRHQAEKIVYVDGFACSIASVIAMVGDKVIIPKNTMMMVHNIWVNATGNAKELRKAADDLDVIMEANRQAYLEKSGGKISEGKLIKLLDEETWLTASRCLEYGFCDVIDNREVDLTEAKQMLQKVNSLLKKEKEFRKTTKTKKQKQETMRMMIAAAQAAEKKIIKELREKWHY